MNEQARLGDYEPLRHWQLHIMAAVPLRAFLCFSLQVWQKAPGRHPLSQGSLFPVCVQVLLTTFLCGSEHTLYTSSIVDVFFMQSK